MRREDLVELAKVHGIDLAAIELTDADLETVIGGMSKNNATANGEATASEQTSKINRGLSNSSSQ